MPITSFTSDIESLTMTVVADFTAPVERLWDAYLNPRSIEQFWGPVEYPATFFRHDGFVGGLSNYCMTGPNGDTSRGYWKWTAVAESSRFEVLDGFALEDGTPNDAMPEMRMVFEFAETALGSRVTTTTHFNSVEEIEKIIGMGMEEGLRSAMSQIDAVLADLAELVGVWDTELQLLGTNQARISRIIRGPIDAVWRAHTEPELLRQWQTGPDGWSMPECEMGATEGTSFKYTFRNDDSGETFGFVGEVIEVETPHRLVSTERFCTPDDPQGESSPETLNELTLNSCSSGTLLTYVITYPDTDTRAEILATGMVDGMEVSFDRLESRIDTM